MRKAQPCRVGKSLAVVLGGDKVGAYSDTEVRFTVEEFSALPPACVDAEDTEKRRKDY